MNEIRVHRELLKQALFNADCSKIPVRKEVIVDLSHVDSKFWPGYGTVEIFRDGPDGYSSFKTHQEFPMKYALNRNEYRSGEYKLVIKQ